VYLYVESGVLCLWCDVCVQYVACTRITVDSNHFTSDYESSLLHEFKQVKELCR